VSGFSVSYGVVVAFGGDLDERGQMGPGISAYTSPGLRLWRRFAGEQIFTARAAQGRIYAELPQSRTRRTLVALELRTGRVVARRTGRGFVPLLVVPEAANRYG
jgi:hypothetical protein